MFWRSRVKGRTLRRILPLSYLRPCLFISLLPPSLYMISREGRRVCVHVFLMYEIASNLTVPLVQIRQTFSLPQLMKCPNSAVKKGACSSSSLLFQSEFSPSHFVVYITAQRQLGGVRFSMLVFSFPKLVIPGALWLYIHRIDHGRLYTGQISISSIMTVLLAVTV